MSALLERHREGDIPNCFGKLHDSGKPAFRRPGILPKQLRTSPLLVPGWRTWCRAAQVYGVLLVPPFLCVTVPRVAFKVRGGCHWITVLIRNKLDMNIIITDLQDPHFRAWI